MIESNYSQQFRIEFIRSGIKYEFKYAKSVEAAIKAARTREFLTEKPTKYFSQDIEKPVEAHITQRLVNTWELVAKVDATGVHVVLYYDRESYKRWKSQLNRVQKTLDENKQASEEFGREVERVVLAELKGKSA